jgi:hypothetical protein
MSVMSVAHASEIRRPSIPRRQTSELGGGNALPLEPVKGSLFPGL